MKGKKSASPDEPVAKIVQNGEPLSKLHSINDLRDRPNPTLELSSENGHARASYLKIRLRQMAAERDASISLGSSAVRLGNLDRPDFREVCDNPLGSQIDDATPDVPGVRYLEVAGDASRGGHELFLFQLAAVIGKLTGEVNDGVVTRASALRVGHEHLADWPVDHAGEVGWSLDTSLPIPVALPFVPAPAHFARYDAIVSML